MSAAEKRKLASPDELQKHIDSLVGSGAIVLGHGKRLKVGGDGLPQVTVLAELPGSVPNPGARERLTNVIKHLESLAPKSSSWGDALNKLHQLLADNVERDGQVDIRAWEICREAHEETKEDIAYMGMLDDIFSSNWDEHEWWDNEYSVIEFPQRACRLLGIHSSGDYKEQAWDDGLAEEVLEKDFEAYRVLHKCVGLLTEFQSGDWAYCEYPKASKVKKCIKLFRRMHPISAPNAIMENDHLLILERKAKTAQRIQANAKSVPSEPAAQKEKVVSD